MSPVTVVINKILLGWVAFGAGFAVAGGFIAFISLIGIVTRLAGITNSIMYLSSLFTGIFAGCLAGALAEVVNIIPIFSRRVKLRKGFPYMVKAAALGKCIGCLIQFYLFNL